MHACTRTDRVVQVVFTLEYGMSILSTLELQAENVKDPSAVVN